MSFRNPAPGGILKSIGGALKWTAMVEIKAYAKINLSLHILNLRADGFHEIVSLAHKIDLWDTVRVEISSEPGIQVRCDNPFVPCDSTNLVSRAYEAISSRRKVPGVVVDISKRIPVAAGLGGGSADAAAALKAFAHILGLSCEHEEVVGCASSVGSDVPFCLDGPAAVLRGRGEQVYQREPLRFWAVVATPDVKISTRDAYRWFDEGCTSCRQEGPLVAAEAVAERLRRATLRELVDVLVNDLEPPVAGRVPCIPVLRRAFVDLGAQAALMSGSGPTVVGIFDEERVAMDAAAALLREVGSMCRGVGVEVFVAQAVSEDS